MKNKTTITILIPVILVIIVAIITLNSLNSNSKNKIDNSEKLFSFESSSGDISFEYPAAYGNASESLKTVSNSSGLVTAGKASTITFSNNKDLYINLASADYQAFKDVYYSGVKDFNDVCVSSEIAENGNGCKVRTIGTFTVLEQTEYLADEGVYNLLHTYSIKLTNNDDYSGLIIMQSIPTIYDKLNANIDTDEVNNISKAEAASILNKSNNVYNQSINEVEQIITRMNI